MLGGALVHTHLQELAHLGGAVVYCQVLSLGLHDETVGVVAAAFQAEPLRGRQSDALGWETKTSDVQGGINK